jgi:hypothetical protein
VENILMLYMNGQMQLFAELGQFVRRFLKGKSGFAYINQSDHRKKILHNGLGNIQDVDVGVKEYFAYAVDDSDLIIADYCNNSSHNLSSKKIKL